MTRASYVPGERTALMSDTYWVLIDIAPESAAVRDLWQRLRRDPGVGTLLSSLLESGLGNLPDFAALFVADGGYRIICRGRAGAAVLVAGTSESIDGDGLVTWREYTLTAEAEQAVLGDVPSDALQLPATAGVFLARGITVDLTDLERGHDFVPAEHGAVPAEHGAVPAEHGAVPAEHGAVPAEHEAVPAEHEAVPAERAAVPAVPGGFDFLAEVGMVTTVANPGDSTDASAGPAMSGPPEVTGPPAQEPAGPGPAGPEFAPSGDAPHELASGQIAFPRPGPAEPRSQAAEPSASPAMDGLVDSVPLGGAVASSPGGAVPSLPADSASAWPGGTGRHGDGATADHAAPEDDATPDRGMISGAPRPLSDAAWREPADDPDDGSEDGLTIRRADIIKQAARSMAADSIGPTVLAVTCPSSHPNPPGSLVCRECRVSMPRQEPVTVPRPSLGVLRLSTGDTVSLDRDVVMGRNPPDDFDGAERPHIIKVPGGDGEVSRIHLRVSIRDWDVFVIDLNSTNGTEVTPPGAEPASLSPNEPLRIEPDTVVTLAEHVYFRYEVA